MHIGIIYWGQLILNVFFRKTKEWRKVGTRKEKEGIWREEEWRGGEKLEQKERKRGDRERRRIEGRRKVGKKKEEVGMEREEKWRGGEKLVKKERKGADMWTDFISNSLI